MEGSRRRSGPAKRMLHGGGDPQVAPSRFVAPRVRDARWVLGVLLLIAGVLGTLRVISSHDHSVRIWTTARALTPGDKVVEADLVARELRFEDAEQRYFLADEKPPRGRVVHHVVGKGEVLPRTALGPTDSLGLAPVVVVVPRAQADTLTPGLHAQLWTATKKDDARGEVYEKPQMAVENIVVRRVLGGGSGSSGPKDDRAVELRVPQTKVADVIEANNGGARITVVPTSGEGVS